MTQHYFDANLQLDSQLIDNIHFKEQALAVFQHSIDSSKEHSTKDSFESFEE